MHSEFLNSEQSGEEAREITENRVDADFERCTQWFCQTMEVSQVVFASGSREGAPPPPAPTPRSHLTCFHIPHLTKHLFCQNPKLKRGTVA